MVSVCEAIRYSIEQNWYRFVTQQASPSDGTRQEIFVIGIVTDMESIDVLDTLRFSSVLNNYISHSMNTVCFVFRADQTDVMYTHNRPNFFDGTGNSLSDTTGSLTDIGVLNSHGDISSLDARIVINDNRSIDNFFDRFLYFTRESDRFINTQPVDSN